MNYNDFENAFAHAAKSSEVTISSQRAMKAFYDHLRDELDNTRKDLEELKVDLTTKTRDAEQARVSHRVIIDKFTTMKVDWQRLNERHKRRTIISEVVARWKFLVLETKLTTYKFVYRWRTRTNMAI